MKYFIVGALPLAFAAGSLLAACAADRESTSVSSGPPEQPSVAVQETRADRKHASEASAPIARTPALAPVASMAYPTGDRDTSAILVERRMPSEAVVGLPVEYETVVTNLTSMPLDQVVLVETVDPNFTVAGSNPTMARSTATENVWSLGTLAPEAKVVIRVRGQAKAAKPVQTCSSVSYSMATCAGFPVVQPALELVASGTAEALVCDELSYRYVVTNSGSGVARDVVVRIALPSGITDAKGRGELACEVNSLASGASQEFTVAAKGSRTGAFRGRATATASGGLEAESNEVSTTLRQPRLKLEGKATTRLYGGRDATAEFILTNIGDGLAREVTVELTVPEKISFKSASDGGVLEHGVVHWKFADLGPGQAIDFAAMGGTGQLGEVTGTAVARAYCAEPVTVEVHTKVEGIPAILLEVVDLADPIQVGSEVTYLITVTNQGTAIATDVALALQVPEESSYVSSSGETATAAKPGASQLSFAPVSRIDAKEKVTWRVTVRGAKAGDGRFKVSMTSRELTKPVEESEATTFYE